MGRKLFCELSPAAYAISAAKEREKRRLKDWFAGTPFALARQEELLPVRWYEHRSLIYRTLGNTKPYLQAGKAVNLSLAAPKIDGVVIGPGQVFSLWRLVGKTSRAKGYQTGLVIENGKPSEGIGGGLCQLSNLIHWMVLHSPLEIVERHHHDQWDLFPDFHRQVPFGVGTSIAYNYLDYRFRNPTGGPVQLRLGVDGDYLWGKLLADRPLDRSYHISQEKQAFVRQDGQVFREGEIWRSVVDKRTGNCLERQLLQKNHALVLYDVRDLPVREAEGTGGCNGGQGLL